jgi:uncharacterized membrane protein YtjA (UPF0391 family)
VGAKSLGSGFGFVRSLFVATIFSQNALTRWALIFLLLTVAVGAFAFAGMAIATAIIAKFLFGLFVLLFFVFLILGLCRRT